jgi:hypothetical protein
LAEVGVRIAGVEKLDEGVGLAVSEYVVQAVLVSLLNKANCPDKVGAGVVEGFEFHFVIAPLITAQRQRQI